MSDPGESWLAAAVARVGREPSSVGTLFPAVARHTGRAPLDPDDDRALRRGSADDAGRAALLQALPVRGEQLADTVQALYRYGDAGEKRGVLRALHLLDADERFLPLVHDGLRSNDVRLVAAALQPYGSRHLDDAAFRQAVLKCVFVGVPLAAVGGLPARADEPLARMLVAYAHERVAAGRDVPADVWPLVAAYPQALAGSGLAAELDADVPARREAARRALTAARQAAPQQDEPDSTARDHSGAAAPGQD